MAGYVGYSKSRNAVQAEKDGKLPITHAVKAVAKAAGCTQTVARAALLEIGADEWHHTSKKYNRTDYYSVAAAVRRVQLQPVIDRLEAEGFRDKISDAITSGENDMQARGTARQAACEQLAVAAFCTVDEVETCYYGTWNDDA